MIQQGLPAFPAAAWEQAQGASMVHGAIEIVGLIPGGQTLIPAQPKAVPEGAQPHSNAKRSQNTRAAITPLLLNATNHRCIKPPQTLQALNTGTSLLLGQSHQEGPQVWGSTSNSALTPCKCGQRCRAPHSPEPSCCANPEPAAQAHQRKPALPHASKTTCKPATEASSISLRWPTIRNQ